jgi:glucosamine-6-phosphate deaminase
MEISISQDKKTCGVEAAHKAADILRQAISQKGHASFIVATGASQFDFLDSLTSQPGIDWSKTTMYHLDEYLGLGQEHPASFRRYLKERLVDRVNPGIVHFVDGDAPDAKDECKRIGKIIAADSIDLACIGIGENGHLAFNDPPADFETEEPFILVELDEACRRQQFGEGWFESLDAVPKVAITMTMRQIMKSHAIVCTVPDERKAQAVRDCFQGEISPMHPASLLRRHERAFVYLDKGSASLYK